MSKEKLCVIFDNTDYSLPMSDFLKKDTTLTIVSEEYLYIGFKKPISRLYFNYTNSNTVEDTITTMEEFDGVNWNSVQDLEDSTYGAANSGFMCWNNDNCDTKCIKSTVNGIEKYWYRISYSEDIVVTLRSVGILFTDDSDIYIEYPILDNAKYRTSVSGNSDNYLNIHVQVRDYIISDIRSTGINKYTECDTAACSFFKQITEFDLFDIDEVRFAARMLAISNIYYKLSDSPDDRWQIDAERYKAEYLRAFNVAFLSIDKNDNGKKEVCEQPTFSTNVRIKR